jgi:SAM-dependent methyltransferase
VADAFAYDAVEYPSTALPNAHPGHLYAVARMFGCNPTPPAQCRVLEVGCGDGTHLIGCAVGLPDAKFVGIDLSAVAIDRGRQMVAELGLPNVKLYAADLTAWEPPGEQFDYVLAHGLYSWVPAPVRDGLLALVRRALAPNGVGYVSYNTYPGCFVRRMVWEMMRFHTNGINNPAEKIGQAREFVRFLYAGRGVTKQGGLNLLTPELEALLKDHDPAVLYHDDLGAVNDPVYFHEFAAHLGRFGLRYVAETEPHTTEIRALPDEIEGVLRGLSDRDLILKEQYLDFLRLRRFRSTLLAADGGSPRSAPDASRITAIAVSGDPKPDPDPPDLGPGVAVSFRHGEAAVQLDVPIAKAALAVLASCWPERVPFPELVRRAAARLGREPTDGDAGTLAGILTDVWMTGLIRLHGHVPKYAAEVSEKPVASPFARLQLRSGPIATTLLHSVLRADDAPTRLLIQLLDGTRDRDQLATELVAAFPPDNRPDAAALRDGIDRSLARLARSGVLVG